MLNAYARAASLAAVALLLTLLAGVASAAVAVPGAATPTVAVQAEPANDATGFSFAVSAIRLLTPILQFKMEGYSGQHLLGGGFLAWGAPVTVSMDKKTQLEVGGHVGWFPLGTVRRGAGMVAQTMVLQSWGELQGVKATSYGVSGVLSASGRWTFDSNALVELQFGPSYIYSWSGLADSDQGSWLGEPGLLVNLWFGWSF